MGIVDGKLSRYTCNSNMAGVISRKAMVEGSVPAPGMRAGSFDTIAYAGRVPVRVVGPVCRGDHITPSGLENGTVSTKIPLGLTEQNERLRLRMPVHRTVRVDIIGHV